MKRSVVALVIFLAGSVLCRADGPADNNPEKVRRVPALGIEISEADRGEVTKQLDGLKASIDPLMEKSDTRTKELLPDVQIYYRAVHDALTYREFFNEQELKTARQLLEQGLERARQLASGQAPW